MIVPWMFFILSKSRSSNSILILDIYKENRKGCKSKEAGITKQQNNRKKHQKLLFQANLENFTFWYKSHQKNPILKKKIQSIYSTKWKILTKIWFIIAY